MNKSEIDVKRKNKLCIVYFLIVRLIYYAVKKIQGVQQQDLDIENQEIEVIIFYFKI